MAGMKGRPPKPKHVLQLVGSKHANNREELGTKPAEAMQPPEWLKPRATEVFVRVVGWLERMGTLAETDEHVITRYCTTYVAWEYSVQQLQQVDCLYKEILGPDGSLRFSRPTAMAAQAKDTGEQLRHLETVLGLTPADRTRLGYGAVKVVADPVDALFDGTSG
jgi:P27 family predicted phage terminase small subunit